jgi:hypothetical protein
MCPVLDELLQTHSKYIAHMRVQLANKRFGLVLGAGVSHPLNFPKWDKLVRRIANDPLVDGNHILATAGDRLS